MTPPYKLESKSSDAVHAPSLRLRQLRGQRDGLVKRIEAATRQRDEMLARLKEVGSAVAAEVEPTALAGMVLLREIEALFQRLLNDPRRSKREKQAIGKIRDDLRLGELADMLPMRDPDVRPARAERHAETASRPDSARVKQLFRKLADSVHPDKVQDPELKAARTELMKAITVAYRAGDLARLLSLERTLATAPPEDPDSREEDARLVAALNAEVRELRAQKRVLDAEVRGLRDQLRHGLLGEADRGGLKDQLDQAREELEHLTQLREFVKAFANGDIDFAEFAEGPPRPESSLEADLEADIEAELAALLSSLGLGAGRQQRHRSKLNLKSKSKSKPKAKSKSKSKR
mgnify:CR=1 FL=1